MRPQLNVITLGVADLQRSRRFYRDGLGWTPLLEVDGEVVFFQVNHGLLLALFGLDDLGRDAGHAAIPGSPISLGQNLESPAAVDEAVARAVDAGATLLMPGKRAEWGGYNAYIADPDGHRWELVHNPGLRVADDGTVVFGDAG